MVMTSVAGRDAAALMSGLVLDARLAACVQILAVESHYRWAGAVQKSDEFVLMMKAKRADYAALEALVRAHHSYAVPEIIALDITAGFAPYLAWVAAETTRSAAS